MAELIADAQAQGVKYLVLPYLMAAERGGGAPYYLQLADRLNTVGEQVKKAGLQLCYHNHGFEFEPLADGRRPLDVLMGAVKPELVKLELDVFWVSLTGADPVAIIKQYSGRIPLAAPEGQGEGHRDPRRRNPRCRRRPSRRSAPAPWISRPCSRPPPRPASSTTSSSRTTRKAIRSPR